MRKPPPICLAMLWLLAVTAGCHSVNTAKQSHRDTPGSFADLSARSAYIDSRVNELTDKGVSREDAAARASREWFARAPAASASPSAQELKRREAQADFEAKLTKQQQATMP